MSDVTSIQMIASGRDRGRGNLLGVQPWMTSSDYASAMTFERKLAGYLASAEAEDWLNPRTIVVFPEYIGTWLAVAGEGRAILRARSLGAAMGILAIRHPLSFIRAFLSVAEKDRGAAALFRIRAEAMARTYHTTFSRLAKTYGVTVVGGSTVLRAPRVDRGEVRAGKGPLYGVSAVFGPDGRAYDPVVRKVFPTGEERTFMDSASLETLPVFETPAGRLGVLICADSWYPQCYEQLEAQRVELIAVPSFIAEEGAWDAPWQGYDGASRPDDVDPDDVGTLTEGMAWRKYAMLGRIAECGATAGINVFLRGSLWDLGAEGVSLMISKDDGPVVASGDGSALLNLWL